MFHFIWPWLLLLIPIPLIKWLRPTQQSTEILAPRMPLFDRIKQLDIQGIRAPEKTPMIRNGLMMLAWTMLILGAARPQWVGEKVDIPQSGRDLMLAVDISPSMKEKDMILKGFQANRLDVVKSVVSDFVKRREGDRVGLILFGSQPYIQAPLSFDTKTINQLLDEAQLGMAGQATAIGDAIMLSVKRLRSRPEQSRVLILLTDGANTAGEIPPEKAVQFAAKEKIKIYTIGIGAERMVQQSIFGSRTVNPSRDLDAKMLTLIAEKTGGQFFRARNTAELGMVYEAVNRLEPVKQDSKSFRPTKDLFFWPLGLCLFFYCLAFFNLIQRIKSMFMEKTA